MVLKRERQSILTGDDILLAELIAVWYVRIKVCWLL
jgi:hypothetical protein